MVVILKKLYKLEKLLLIHIYTVIPCTGMHALKPKYLKIDAALNTRFLAIFGLRF